MFTLNYFWFFIAAMFFMSPVVGYASSSLEGANPIVKILSGLIGGVCSLALLIFVILGFWHMPSWWMPLVMALIGWGISPLLRLVSNPLANLIVILLGLILAPLFTILAYLGMFNVI